MKQYEWIPGRSCDVLSLLAVVLIGTSAARAQEAEWVLTPIRNVIATSNAASDDSLGPQYAADGSGLNASGQHSTWVGDMWLADPGGEPTYIQFEFDEVYELEEMWVWNYNGWLSIAGVNEVTIEYSENGTDWTVFGNVECAEATGKDDYTANTIVALDGIRARYVRLTILSTRGIFSWPGLSEVRFWTYTEPTYRIYNVAATSKVPYLGQCGPENTVNDSGINANGGHSTVGTDMWMVDPNGILVDIQFEFDGPYELEEMWIWNFNIGNAGAKDVTIAYSENGTDWTVFGDVQCAPASGATDYAANTFVSLNGIVAQYVRLTIHNSWPMNAFVVNDSGEKVPVEQTGLSEVRFYTRQALAAKLSSYVLVLDDFEAYTDNDNLNEAIFQTWIDSALAGGTSQIGHTYTPFAETDIVNSGLQAMPFYYDNTRSPYYAETYRNLETELQDWQIEGADALTLFFHGSADKDHEIGSDRLYLVVEDEWGQIALAHHPDPEALLANRWQEWSIDFAELAGVDLSHVTRLTLGIGDLDDPRPGGKSIIYIDDIGLTTTTSGTDSN